MKHISVTVWAGVCVLLLMDPVKVWFDIIISLNYRQWPITEAVNDGAESRHAQKGSSEPSTDCQVHFNNITNRKCVNVQKIQFWIQSQQMEQINLICCERAVINCRDVSRSNEVQWDEVNVSPRDNLNLFLLLIKEYFIRHAVVTTRRLTFIRWVASSETCSGFCFQR